MCYDDFKLRDEAVKLGLKVDSRTHDGRVFYYDLNYGQIYGSTDPDKVFALVKLARKCASFDGDGEHNALLNLVARKDELGDESSGRVCWHRVYYTNARNEPDAWISLRDFLTNNGHDTSEVFEEEGRC